ncbi:MAG: hypothetical protein EOO01_07385 [Chitinophagaceae bacterium]|nr:MAG: hypothetical protein EOO01_07385 [Chitinophagaceae bacterium]
MADDFLNAYPDFFQCKNYKAKQECFKTTFDPAWKPDKKRKLEEGYKVGNISFYGDGVFIAEGNILSASSTVRLRFSTRLHNVSIDGGDVQGAFITRRDIDAPAEFKNVVLKAKEKKTVPQFKCAKQVANSLQQNGSRMTISSEEGFDCLEIKPARELKINTICTVSLSEKKKETKAKADCQVSEKLIKKITETVTVLEPGAYYRIKVDLSVKGTVTNDITALLIGEDEVVKLENSPFSVESFFQTEAPPSNLQPYIKWMSPVAGQPDFFYENDFNFCFNRPYMRSLYDNSDAHKLELLLKDAEGNCISGFYANWTKSLTATLLPEEKKWKQYVDPANSLAVPLDDQFQARRFFLFMEDFNRLDVNTWTVGNTAEASLARWRTGLRSLAQQAMVSGGISVLSARAGTYIVAGNIEWTQYRFSAYLQSSANTPTKAAGVLFCYIDDRHYYLATLSEQDDTLQLIKFNGEENGQVLSSVPYIGDLKLLTNLEVEVGDDSLGNKLIGVYLKNEKLIEYKDLSNHLTNGKIGLYSFQSAGISFSRIRVSPLVSMLNPSSRYELLLAGGEGGSLLVEDLFNETPLSNKWIAPASSNWSTVPATGNERYGTLRSGSNSEQQVLLADKLTDFDMTLWIKRDGKTGIIFRQAGSKDLAGVIRNHDYRLKLEANIYRLHHAIEKLSAKILEEKSTRFGSFDWIRLRIRLVGSRCSVWEFDQLLFSIDLRSKYSEHEPNGMKLISNGCFGLLATGVGDKFKRLTIRDVALVRCNITTSRYESIMHLMYSCPPASILPIAVASLPARQNLLSTGDLFSQAIYACWKASVDFRHTIINREQFEAVQLVFRNTKSDLDRLFIEFCKQLSDYFFVPLENDLEIRLIRHANRIKGIWLKSHESLRMVRPLNNLNSFTGNNSLVIYRKETASQISVDIDMIANSDSNQVLLLCKGTGYMPPGNYLIVCHYFRDSMDASSNTIDHFYDRPIELYESLSGRDNFGEMIEIPFVIS